MIMSGTKHWRAWLAIAALSGSAIAVPTQRFYVATSGSDAWSGEVAMPTPGGADGPFRTIQRARDAIRTHRAAGAQASAYVVGISGGTHVLRETLVFRPEDSGTPDCPVTYEGAGDEKPVLSGGIPISGWTQGAGAERHLWVAQVELPKASPLPNQLFIDGVRRIRARTCLRGAGRSRSLPEPLQSLRFRDGDLAQLGNVDDILIRAYSSWIVSLHWIRDINQEQRVVTFTNRGWEFGRFDQHQRYVIENCQSALDMPGEWFLRRDGRLTYWPLAAESPSAVTAIMPLVRERLVQFSGDPGRGQYVEHLTFRGLSFRHVDWTVDKARRYDHQDYAAVSWATLQATGLRSSRFLECEVANGGVHGIYLLAGCQDNTIARCHVHDTGGGGIYVGSRKSTPDGSNAVCGNTVDNNLVHDVGRVFGGSVGIYLGRGAHNTVSHNEVCDVDWSGMSIGNPGEPDSTGHVVEFNRIHHVLRGMLSDGAGIYTLGASPGTVIRNNVIHDVFAYPTCPGRGIYHDTMSSGYTCENNVVVNVGGYGILQCGQTQRITVRNNVFAFCGQGGICRASPGGAVVRNIVLLRDSRAMLDRVPESEELNIDRNLYWHSPSRGSAARFDGKDLAAWQERGLDTHGLIADPLFVDPEKGNFTLLPDSPALALGFQPVDMAAPGRYGDSDWMSLPERARSATAPLPVFPPAPPPAFADDFESSVVGALPGCFACVAEQKGKIRVTDGDAADGGRCLKITDAPGMKSFYPYMYDQTLRCESGTVTFSVDLKQDVELPGAAHILFRDYAPPRSQAAAGGPEGNSYAEGPVVALTEARTIVANGRYVARVPAGEWVRVSLEFELGLYAPREYTVRAERLGGGELAAVDSVPFVSPHFQVLTGLFVTSGSSPTDTYPVFYIDNLQLRHSRAAPAP